MVQTYWAHSAEGLNGDHWQLLADHLRAVAKLSGQNADKFGAGDWGHAAGLLHDLGKYSAEFQARLAGDKGRVDHARAGARLAAERWKIAGLLLGFAIAGHHAGLANGTGEGVLTPLETRLSPSNGADNLDEAAVAREIDIPDSVRPPPMTWHADRAGLALSHFTRMIFSCLIDADRIDTERYYLGLEGREPGRGAWQPLLVLRAALDAHLATLQHGADPTPVNQIRAEILAAARAKATEAPGHFAMTVPTGGGKTLASLAFALDHAIAHGLDRVIYVIPYTSIIEQTAEVFRATLGEHRACVLEHHSAFDDEKLVGAARQRGDLEHGLQGREKLRLAAENWDAPIVVTTAVQFFESLFANSPSRCRKLHNISRSVVILDEAQTLPLPLLRPSVVVLDELAKNYGTSIVLCTATQPVLEETDQPDRSFKGGLRNVREIAPEPKRLYAALKRVTVTDLGPIDDGNLVERLAGHEQALCIVHTRAHARELYLTLKDQPGTVHLSALMCPEHRSQRLVEIKQRLKVGLPCRLISTSLIEAGVDVDFPVVYRASAGLDSIAQAAGRCNREGKRPAGVSHVYVFEPVERKLPSSMSATVGAGREMMRLHAADPLSLEAIEGYFRHVYWSRSVGQSDGLDKHGILIRLQERAMDQLFCFEDIARDFRLITDALRPILIPYDRHCGRGAHLIAELEAAENVGSIARKLQRYVVQVPRSAFAALAAAGSIQAVNPHRFGDQFWRLANVSLYHDEFGLDWNEPTFRRAEDLVW